MFKTPPFATDTTSLLADLREFERGFKTACARYDGTGAYAEQLEATTENYTRFVLDRGNALAFDELDRAADPELASLAERLREVSAHAASTIEKYRALRLLDGMDNPDGYFASVQSCIDTEFGSNVPGPGSTVVLIGSGSVPVTLLGVAQSTGARAVGVDIDLESVHLARQVVQRLANDDVEITIESSPLAELPAIAEATHIVISSTAGAKYEILRELKPLTRHDVVVVMRYGNGLKSLFNYPRQNVDPQQWAVLDEIQGPERLFDIAIYAKPGVDAP